MVVIIYLVDCSQSFQHPKINTDDLNETFFQLKGFMKFAKVDDDVATKALDRVVDAMEDETLKQLEGSQHHYKN